MHVYTKIPRFQFEVKCKPAVIYYNGYELHLQIPEMYLTHIYIYIYINMENKAAAN